MSDFMKEKELCEKVNISRSTLYRLRKKGLPYKKIGGSIRYNYEEVMNWMEINK